MHCHSHYIEKVIDCFCFISTALLVFFIASSPSPYIISFFFLLLLFAFPHIFFLLFPFAVCGKLLCVVVSPIPFYCLVTSMNLTCTDCKMCRWYCFVYFLLRHNLCADTDMHPYILIHIWSVCMACAMVNLIFAHT